MSCRRESWVAVLWIVLAGCPRQGVPDAALSDRDEPADESGELAALPEDALSSALPVKPESTWSGDSDGDHFPDERDPCPDEPEDLDAVDDGDGCPEVEEGLAILRCEQLELREPIEFEYDDDQIRPSSYPVLDAVAAILMTATLDGVTIQILGHMMSPPDGIEWTWRARDLSQSRADSVREALTDRGVPPEMLETIGYGDTVPLYDPSDPELNRHNLRVELHVDRGVVPGCVEPKT